MLGVMNAIAELKPAVEVRGYMAIAENMPGGRAQKPGDVVKAFNGKTIEVLNTDAEGRLVLSDALSYASSKNPDVIIDIATLTGACVVALGHRVSAVMTNTPKLFSAIQAAGEKAGEKFWELPLEKEYQPDVKSKIADLQNIGKRRGEAGTIIGGLFLQEFVDGRPWAHLDIAGPSWTDSDQPYCSDGRHRTSRAHAPALHRSFVKNPDKKETSMEMTGAQIVCEVLKREGVEVVFGILGGANLPLNDALGLSGLRFVLTRHEQGASHMADGYARATYRPGVCFGDVRSRRNQSGHGAGHRQYGFHSRRGDHRPSENRVHRFGRLPGSRYYRHN